MNRPGRAARAAIATARRSPSERSNRRINLVRVALESQTNSVPRMALARIGPDAISRSTRSTGLPVDSAAIAMILARRRAGIGRPKLTARSRSLSVRAEPRASEPNTVAYFACAATRRRAMRSSDVLSVVTLAILYWVIVRYREECSPGVRRLRILDATGPGMRRRRVGLRRCLTAPGGCPISRIPRPAARAARAARRADPPR